MELGVFSEIGRLREVLVHEPGPEVDSMPPSLMRELLFDDIIYGERARAEHRRFRAILEARGAVARDIQDLLRQAIEASPDGARELVADVVEMDEATPETAEELAAMEPGKLAAALIQGLPAPAEEAAPDDLFRLSPLPNLLFTRDAQVVLADGVIIGAMHSRARQREPLLGRFVFRHHPELRRAEIRSDFLHRRPGRGWQQNVTPTLEGGDILIFEEGIVLAGVGERTMERAADFLAADLRAGGTFHTLIMVPLPATRSTMHLDTVFTRISEDECLVYGPMILPDGPETLSVISVDLRRREDWGRRHPSLLHALRERGVDLRPVPCGGGDDYIRQAREQWTDGANTFALAPGFVLLYSRNERTADELSRHGYEVTSAASIEFASDGRCLHTFPEGKKHAVLLPGEELSRARGGPRCMTMPLRREPVKG